MELIIFSSLSSYMYTQAIDKTRTQPDRIIHVNRSCAYSAQSRYKEALVDANMAIKIKPNDYLGWVGKGRALFGLGFLGEFRQGDRICELVLTFVCRDGQRSIRTSTRTEFPKRKHTVLDKRCSESY